MRTELTGLADELRSVCAGQVLERNDDGYAAAVTGVILSVDRRPAVVLRAESVDDLVAATRAAGRVAATVGVLATGHASRATPEVDLLIVTSAMRGVSVDPVQRTARVEAGASWGDVLRATEPYGLVGLSGSHATVGAVGYTLGGGLGTLARSHGFAADRVRSFEVVTAGGELITVDEMQHPELFRVLCGGGRQGIALVAGMTIELVELAGVTGGSIGFAAGNAAEVRALFSRYLDWTRIVAEAVTSSLSIVRLPDLAVIPRELRGRTVIQLDVCHVGEPSQAAADLDVVRSWGEILLDDVGRRPYSSLAIGETPVGPGWGGALALAEVTEDLVGRWIDAVGPQREVPFVLAQLRHLGGAMARTGRGSPERTVAGREAAYLVFLSGVPVAELIAGPIPALADEIFAMLAPWALGTLPTNYADPLTREAREASWLPEQRAELRAVQDVWDPNGMFAGWAG